MAEAVMGRETAREEVETAQATPVADAKEVGPWADMEMAEARTAAERAEAMAMAMAVVAWEAVGMVIREAVPAMARAVLKAASAVVRTEQAR